MTPDDDLDRQIQAYLESGPAELADRVLWAARVQLKTTRRRRPGFAWLAPWRNTQMTQNTRLWLVGGALVVAIGVGVIGSILARPNPGPAASAPPSAPGLSAAPSPAGLAATPAAPSSSAGPGPSSSVASARAPGWSATGAMAEGRDNHTATLLSDGKVLVAGGRIGPNLSGSASSAELYDPASGTWSTTGGMHGARDSQIATRLLDGTVLVGGGNSHAGGQAVTTAELYDPISGTWTATGDMLSERSQTVTLLLNGEVLVAGSDFNPNVPELYDPISGTWSATRRLIALRLGPTATLLPDGMVLMAGGQGRADDPASAELYDPSIGTWTRTGNMKVRRTGATAILLTDGRVLVLGGLSPDRNRHPLVSAELYDPVTGSWTATGNMVTTREGGYSATLLPDGRVLVAGGFRKGGAGMLASAELYDPITGSWKATASLGLARANQTATLLPSGEVLIAGGLSVVDGLAQPQASSELYDPGSGN